jgi:hypothetical protein
MSTSDQCLLIANSNYHVGQQVAVYVAQEQGYFQEEGLDKFDYDGRGLIRRSWRDKASVRLWSNTASYRNRSGCLRGDLSEIFGR